MIPSKNSIAQALKIERPDIGRRDFLRLLSVPDCMTANMRYWYERYNILPWHRRTEEEKRAALEVARNIIKEKA